MSDKFITLADDFLVSPQISAADLEEAAALGVTLVINNRPDGEMIGQPKNAELEAAAKALGLKYVFIPVDGRGIGPDQLAAFDAAMSEPHGKTLAFCRTGTRSTLVRSYAAAKAGRPAEEIIAEAAAAGYDIRAHEPALRSFAVR